MDITRVILSNWGYLLANAKCQQIAVEIGGEIMAFINQMMFGLTDKRCGAFAIAYWLWLEGNNTLPINDEKVVEDIYIKIRFTHGTEHIDKEFSNPFKMVKYINDNYSDRYTASLKCNSDCVLKLVQEMHVDDIVGPFPVKSELPKLRVGEFAILMVSSDSSINPTHYVLVEKDENGINVIDPVNGIRMNYAGHNIDTLNPGVFGYYNCYTAIYINPVDDKA